MAGNSSVKASLVNVVVPTAAGWKPGDFAVKLGSTTQIGLDALGVRVERPDPLLVIAAAGLATMAGLLGRFNGAVVYTDLAGSVVRVAGSVLGFDGSAGVRQVFFLVNAAGLMVSVTSASGVAFFLPNAAGSQALIGVVTDGLGVFSLEVTGAAAGAALWQGWTNGESLPVVSHAVT